MLGGVPNFGEMLLLLLVALPLLVACSLRLGAMIARKFGLRGVRLGHLLVLYALALALLPALFFGSFVGAVAYAVGVLWCISYLHLVSGKTEGIGYVAKSASATVITTWSVLGILGVVAVVFS